MAWISGTISVEKAVAAITQLAVRQILEHANKDGEVNMTLENDGTYYFPE